MHQESVELCFRQWIGAFLLDRILSGHDEKEFGQTEGLATDAHLMLGHGFQQRGLNLGRSPVHLVCEQQVVENRTRLELE